MQIYRTRNLEEAIPYSEILQSTYLMSITERVFEPHSCWLCGKGNSSTANNCEMCNGFALPTRCEREEFTWAVFSFDFARHLKTETSPCSYFYLAMDLLQTESRFAIRIADKRERLILVHYSSGGPIVFSKVDERKLAEGHGGGLQFTPPICGDENEGAGRET